MAFPTSVDSIADNVGQYLHATDIKNLQNITVGPTMYNVKGAAYGPAAKGDGATDDAAALNAVIDQANTLPGKIVFPAGTYKYNSALHPITSSNVTVEGVGWSSELRPTGNFDALSFTSSGAGAWLYGVDVSDIFVNCVNSTGGNGIRIKNTYNATIKHPRVSACQGSAILCDGFGGAGGFGAYTDIITPLISTPVGAAAVGIQFSNHEHSQVWGGEISWHNVSGQVGILSRNMGIKIKGVEFDANDMAIQLYFIDNNVIEGCWFDRGFTRFLLMQGNRRCIVSDNTFGACVGSGPNMVDINDAQNAGNVFHDNQVWPPTTGWTNWLVEQAGTGSRNVYHDNGTGGLGVSLVTGVMRNNPGYNPQGVAAISVTASPFTYTNNDGVDEAVYIDGGTVSAIAKNGITVYTSTGKMLMLAPSEALTVTYSSLPTMNKDRK